MFFYSGRGCGAYGIVRSAAKKLVLRLPVNEHIINACIGAAAEEHSSVKARA
jgi:hypothetical protein